MNARIDTTVFPPSHFALADEIPPRAVEMADRMREAAGAYGSATYADLIAAGFTSDEIVAHEQVARVLATTLFVRNDRPAGDRVQDIIVKAIAAAAHVMPRCSGHTPDDDAADAWGLFCAARAAWKLDPWVSQQERCINLLQRFLSHLPLLPREINRVTFALAAHMKAHRHG
jgi:hypothetical protein